MPPYLIPSCGNINRNAVGTAGIDFNEQTGWQWILLCGFAGKQSYAKMFVRIRLNLHAVAWSMWPMHRVAPFRTGRPNRAHWSEYLSRCLPWHDAGNRLDSMAFRPMRLSSRSTAPKPATHLEIIEVEFRLNLWFLYCIFTHWLNGVQVGTRWHKSRITRFIMTQDCRPVALACKWCDLMFKEQQNKKSSLKYQLSSAGVRIRKKATKIL